MQASKFTRRAAAAIALAAALPLAAWAQAKDPVRVGLVSSKSGVFAQQGEEVIRAVQFAVEEANAKGGVDGRKVDVQVGDDESNPEAGRRVADKLARDGYNLLTGPILSSVSLALAQSLDRWDAALFGAISKSDKLTGDTCKSRSFRTNHSDAMDLAMINEWAKNFKERKFAVLAADYVWGRDSAESFERVIKAQGKTVSLSVFPPVGTKDFSPYIAQIKASDAEAIWVAEVGRDAIAFIKQAQEFGLIPQKKLIGHALILNFIINGTDKALEGTIGNTAYTPDIDTPRNKAFVAAWKAKFNRLPTDNEGQSYNAMLVMFDGVKRAGSVKPADVAKAVRGATVETLYGPATMRAQDNQLVLPTYAARAKVADGVLRPVIEQRFDTAITPPPSPLCKM